MLKRVMVGSKTELLRPCGRWKTAPSGLLIPWTRPTELLAKAIPPKDAASIMPWRATWLPGFFQACTRCLPTSSTQESANASVIVIAFLETNASIPCVNVSTPTFAVSDRGIDRDSV